MASILILNGPNLNLLGTREPEIYGLDTLDDIETISQREAERLDLEIDFRQSNHEGELIQWIQQAHNEYDGIIINAAAYTHTSLAIADALKAADLPIIELHLSNVYARGEAIRKQSFIAPIADAVICGFGASGYPLALIGMKTILNAEEEDI